MNNLEKLFYFRGVSAEYLNYSAERIVVPHEIRVKLLEAVGYDVTDDEAVAQAVYELDALPWKSWLKTFNILRSGESEYLDIRVHPEEKTTSISYQITTEAGELLEGELTPAELPEVGEYYIDGIRYRAHRYPLAGLPLGYHQIVLSNASRKEQAVLAVVPPKCFEIGNGHSDRLWGINCQLYTLRSERNWGIGDFSDLMELIAGSASVGMDVVALNPLHALDMSAEDFSSPYSPSDRCFLNPLYLDPERIPEFWECQTVVSQFRSPACQKKLAALRGLTHVDYRGVAELKYPVYEALFQHFLAQEIELRTERAKAFDLFVQQRNDSLTRFSQHESRLDCQSLGVSRGTSTDPRFHQYLQWLAQQQLQQCQTLALECGMSVGLMGDLAVGAVKEGAEVQGNAELFCDAATIGAPPDPFAPQGQNWNLPAPDPIALQRDNYRHFIELLAANMSCVGAIRIDHVMGLLRLWWCLPGLAGGAYVYYPFEDLLAILCLESHRNNCMVIGEDLGVVPQELRSRMAATAVYGNKVFYFETTHDRQFKPPQDHQVDAMLMVTNHDVATLAGWWNLADLSLRAAMGLVDTVNELPDRLRQRRADKIRLLAWLRSQELLPESWLTDNSHSKVEQPFDISLCGAILRACARSRSRMMLFQLDDLQLLEEPVNIPGTHREYPNWRKKQAIETKALFKDSQILALLASTYRERKQ